MPKGLRCRKGGIDLLQITWDAARDRQNVEQIAGLQIVAPVSPESCAEVERQLFQDNVP